MQGNREKGKRCVMAVKDTVYRQAVIDMLERKKDRTTKGDIGNFYNTILDEIIASIYMIPPVSGGGQ